MRSYNSYKRQRQKSNILVVGIYLIATLLLAISFILMPNITININGDKSIILDIGDDYEEYGATSYLKIGFSKKELPVAISGNVDTSKIGNYPITYHSKYHFLNRDAIRIVKVIDRVNPVITFNSDVTICRSNNLVALNATATDNYDGDITNNIRYKVIDDKIHIVVADSSNNVTEVTKDLKYIDSEKPIISLKNSSKLYIKQGDKYVEYGAEAKDTCDGDITKNIKISGDVNTNVLGTYEVFYQVKDSEGNETIAKRLIYVQEQIENSKEYQEHVDNGVIYLTFDDGPGPYTQEILDTLNKYEIKATFFVTNQFSNQTYLSYIKKEYEQGHTVGIHTYSHKWSIYESLDTYLDDFNKIHEIVVAQTGVEPKFFRFPGGTSNHQAKVSMKKLAELMTEKGYTYFDWHIDCGDTHGKKATKEYIINMVKTHLKGNGNYIILMHDIKKNTRDALPEIIEYAKSRGYVFRKIDENTPLKQFKPYN